jgi:hypothetical protein
VQGHAQAAGDALPKALEELQDHTLVLRVLGSYPEAH